MSQLAELGLRKGRAEPVSKRQRKKDQNKSRSKDSSGDKQTEIMKQVVQLLLRHEDTLHVLTMEHEFVVHLHPGAVSLLPLLLKQTQEFQRGDSTVSLRHTLALLMVETVLERLEKLHQAPAEESWFKACLETNLINADRTMPFLYWCPKNMKMLPSKDKSMQIGEVLHNYQSIVRIMKQDEETTLRFHSLTKMKAEEARAILFLWTVRSRSNGELWHHLKALCYHSSWQRGLASLRPQNQQRSGLAKQLQQQL